MRLSSEELAEIREACENYRLPWDGLGGQREMQAHRRKLLSELDWVTAERDAWKARYYRMAEALGKAREQSEALYDGDSGTISVVDAKEKP
jgi:hypothetical protein